MVKIRDYKEHLLQQLQDADEAAVYLNAALNDGDPDVLLLALRDIAEATDNSPTREKEKCRSRREIAPFCEANDW